jgi:hypothetical protein
LEFAYIPDDLRTLIKADVLQGTEDAYQGDIQCRLATPGEKEIPLHATPEKLDHICTLLAALRTKLDPKIHAPDLLDDEIAFFQGLFLILDLIEKDGTPIPEHIRDFFDLSPGDAMVRLWQTWSTSETHLDLALVEDLVLEGSPEISPRRVRGFVTGLVEDLDPETWWSLESFVSQVKDKCPDFLRSGGDYDAWFIKEGLSGEYLRGFEHWENVEGALLRYLISGPLHWLGVLDVAKSADDGPITAFRHSSFANQLFGNQAPEITPRKPEKVGIRAKGEIRMTSNVPHKTRYQVARFCDWGPIKAEAYLYSISPASLERAEEQGLRVAHLLTLLRSHADSIPPNIQLALERWEKQGVQASIEKKTILRLGSPAVIKSLKKSKANRFIIEQLGPTTVVISEGSEEKIKEALVELGYFIDIKN